MWSTGVETGAGPHSFQAAPLTGPLLEPKQAGLLLPDTQHQPSKAKQVWQAFYTDSIKIFHPLENLYMLLAYCLPSERFEARSVPK